MSSVVLKFNAILFYLDYLIFTYTLIIITKANINSIQQ
jgi:hypothetical protein